MAESMRIGELSRLTEVSVRALRYCEQEGLIRSARGGNGYREFDAAAVESVRQIRGLIECGLPTRLIREILPYPDGTAELLPEEPCDWMLDEVARHREQLAPGQPTVFDLADGPEALAALAAGTTVGKLALRPWGCGRVSAGLRPYSPTAL